MTAVPLLATGPSSLGARSPAALAAELEARLVRGALDDAEDLIAQTKWTVAGSPLLQRLEALLLLLKGDAKAGYERLERGARRHEQEAHHWLVAARRYPMTGAFPDAATYLAQVQIERLRASPYMDYPTEVHLETSTTCNARCTFCPYPKLDRLGTRMPDALIDKVLGDLEGIPRELPFSFCPFKVNDPFIDKRIFDICAAINRRLPQARLRLFTNGSPLTEKAIERTARIERLQHLWISLNETDPEAYESVMGLPLDRTLACLDRLHQAVAGDGFPHPVVVSRVRSRGPEDTAFVEFVQDRYPRFTISMLPFAAWAGQIESPESPTIPPTGCARWFELSIMSTGKVALCCMDGEGLHVIGDVSTGNALSVYNHPDYRRLRSTTPTRLDAGSPCSTCAL